MSSLYTESYPNSLEDAFSLGCSCKTSVLDLHVQGDTECWPKPPVDFKAKVLFWLGLARTGQAKAELLFRSQREVLANVLCHPVVNRESRERDLAYRPFVRHTQLSCSLIPRMSWIFYDLGNLRTTKSHCPPSSNHCPRVQSGLEPKLSRLTFYLARI